jgi:mannose-6-phosphate isomerase-like protein (cupin superfamily)
VRVRRVVTGHDPEGKATCVADEFVAPVTLDLLPGNEFHRLWGADSTPTFPDDGSIAEFAAYFPPVGGFRFGLFNIPPDSERRILSKCDIETAYAEFEQKLPGMAQHLELDDPGMHTTATVDYGIVLSGRPVLELDDGEEVELNPGDTYIQNGTRHRWSNPGEQPALLAVTLIGAVHRAID